MVPATASSAWGAVDECRAHFFFGPCVLCMYYVWLIGQLSGLGGMKGEVQCPLASSAPSGNSQCVQHTCVYMTRSAAPSVRRRGVIDNAMRAQLAYIHMVSQLHRIMIDSTGTIHRYHTNWDTPGQTWSKRRHSPSLERAKRDAVRRDLPVGTRRLTLAGSYAWRAWRAWRIVGSRLIRARG